MSDEDEYNAAGTELFCTVKVEPMLLADRVAVEAKLDLALLELQPGGFIPRGFRDEQ